jgi:hypothetical protein
MLAIRSGDAAQAVTLAHAALEHEELAANPTWHIVLGSGLLEQGLYDEAEGAYRRVYDAVPQDQIGRGISLQVYLRLIADLATCRVARDDWAGAVDAAAGILPTVRDALPGEIQRSAEVQLTAFVRISARPAIALALVAVAPCDADARTTRGGFRARSAHKGSAHALPPLAATRGRQCRQHRPAGGGGIAQEAADTNAHASGRSDGVAAVGSH